MSLLQYLRADTFPQRCQLLVVEAMPCRRLLRGFLPLPLPLPLPLLIAMLLETAKLMQLVLKPPVLAAAMTGLRPAPFPIQVAAIACD